jgi:hypothetical protein
MLFETLLDMQPGTDESRAAAQLVQRVKLIAMLANQLPLIAISRLEQPPQDGVLRHSTNSGDLFGPRTLPIKVAAFSDINDLLTYPISENWKTALYPEYATRFQFINFPVTNARWASLGMMVNPARAHTGYWRNQTVISAIAHGLSCSSAQ